MPIRLLSPEVASQIAAGEVIERPASVVKELLENALDAGAKSISITIADAGRTLIDVADDGCGIPPDELELSISRHATSKLEDASQLFNIATLGFRGEALAAIGAVSRLTITSRVEGRAAGARLQVEAGKAGKLELSGAPVGTVVRVESLFFNVPARLKFLKTDLTEHRAIDALVTRYALAFPRVRFKLIEGGTNNLQTPGSGDRRTILASLYGIEIARQMLEVLADETGLKLEGFISPIAVTRSNRREITFFVNGRWVQDVPLATALLQAYHSLLMVGRYPLAALFLEISPEDVDVNVHPAKAEVRFRNQDRLFSFIQRSVRRTLMAYAPVPQFSQRIWANPSGTTDPAWSLAHTNAPLSGAQQSSVSSVQSGLDDVRTSEFLDQGLAAGSRQRPMDQIPLLRLIGQIGATYLVAEGPDGLYLIDQHAAHERVLFEKLMVQRSIKNIASQALLTPLVVELSPSQAKLLSEQLGVLNRMGFEVEEFGAHAFQVRTLPAVFAGMDAALAIRAVVEDFEEDETPLQAEVEARLAGRVCKRFAVKAGQVLSSDEQHALLSGLKACGAPRTCPHGRPTMIHLSVDLLERQFGRRGAR